MHRTTINLPDAIVQQAKLKALKEQLTISEVLRQLLARWVTGEIILTPAESERDRLVASARAARGMWADRDADSMLAASRAELTERDQELADARLAV